MLDEDREREGGATYAEAATRRMNGPLDSGKGTMKFGSGAFEGPYSFASRMEEGRDEPRGADRRRARGCFSMALSGVLTAGGNPPESIKTDAKVRFDKEGQGWAIKSVALTTRARVPGMDDDAFRKAAEVAKENCPGPAGAGGVEISLDAALES